MKPTLKSIFMQTKQKRYYKYLKIVVHQILWHLLHSLELYFDYFVWQIKKLGSHYALGDYRVLKCISVGFP